MNFKHWLYLNEDTNSIPEDDGTPAFWTNIPKEKLYDVIGKFSDKKNPLEEFKNQLGRRDKTVFHSLLSTNQGFKYDNMNKANNDRSLVGDLTQKSRDYMQSKSDYVIIHFKQAREFDHFMPTDKLLLSLDQPHPNYEKKSNGKFRLIDTEAPQKIYVNVSFKDEKYMDIFKELIEYFIKNILFFRLGKFCIDPTRRETFIFYTSPIGETKIPQIQSDVGNILKKYGSKNPDNPIVVGTDSSYEDDVETGGYYIARILSILALSVNLDKKLILDNLNYALEKGLWTNKRVRTAKTIATHKQFIDFMNSKGINIKEFAEKIAKADGKTPLKMSETETSPSADEKSNEKSIETSSAGKIPLGKVHVQLVGNSLKAQGSKAMFDVRLEPNQLQQLTNLTKLENIMGNEPVKAVDYSQKGPAGLNIKQLGIADAYISKNALHLNKTQIPLNQKQVQFILNMLGMDESDFNNNKNSSVYLTAQNGKTVKISTTFFVGKNHFSDLPDFNRFYSDKQFNLKKDNDGSWTIQQNPSATNQTYLNDMPLNQPQKLTTGMKVTIGKSGKCPLSIQIK
jgi:hypothetical protein